MVVLNALRAWLLSLGGHVARDPGPGTRDPLRGAPICLATRNQDRHYAERRTIEKNIFLSLIKKKAQKKNEYRDASIVRPFVEAPR